MRSTRSLRVLFISLLALAVPLVAASSASAVSTYYNYECDTGGNTNLWAGDYASSTNSSFMQLNNSCASNGGYLQIRDDGSSNFSDGKYGAWTFTAPTNTQIISGTQVRAKLEEHNGLDATLRAGGNLWIRGTPTAIFTAYTYGGGPVSTIEAKLHCSTSTSCLNDGTSDVRMKQMNVLLQDNVSPYLNEESTSTLLNSGPQRSSRTLNLTAQDRASLNGTAGGGGLREVKVTDSLATDAQLATAAGESMDKLFTCDLISGTTARVKQPCALDQPTKSYTIDTTKLADGSHAFLICAMDYDGDGAGANSTCHTKTVTIDNTTPQSTINPPKPDRYTTAKSPRFTGTVNEATDAPNGAIECSLDGGTWTNCKATSTTFDTGSTYTNLADTPDPHVFRVRATDTAGNQESKTSNTSNNTHTWTIDTTPPQTYIDLPLPEPQDHAPSLHFHAVDSSSASPSTFEYKCRHYQGTHATRPSEITTPFTDCSDPKTLSLEDGDWTFEVRGRDAVDNEDASEAYHEWTVTTLSNECNVPVYDGYMGTAYVRVSLKNDPDQERQVCYRVDDGPGGVPTTGGALVIGNPGASAPMPTQEDVTCPTGNVTDFTVSGNRFAIYESHSVGQVVVCVQAGSVGKRITFTTPGATGVSVPTNVPDHPSAVTPGPLSPTDSSYPSSTCQNAPASERSQILNAQINGSHVWLYERKPSGSVVQLCARAEGPVNIGGLLEVDAGGLGSLTPIEDHGSGTAPCTQDPPILSMTVPVPLYINTSNINTGSPTANNPASICIGSGSTTEHVTLGFSGSLLTPHVTWKPDPGTPPGFQVGPLPA